MIVIATIKSWHIDNFYKYIKDQYQSVLIENKDELTVRKIKKLNPEYIFFPHWSWKIPKEIYENYHCIVFHMTDLPYGRGGSPLQNLIVNGHKNTKISAIKVIEELDAGDIYLKEYLSLDGNAEEIFIRMSEIIFKKMIPSIINDDITTTKQKGKAVTFKRRKKEDGNISNLKSLDKVYDYIRMLDAEGYPPAFIKAGDLKFEFSKANLNTDCVTANIKITLEGIE